MKTQMILKMKTQMTIKKMMSPKMNLKMTSLKMNLKMSKKTKKISKPVLLKLAKMKKIFKQESFKLM